MLPWDILEDLETYPLINLVIERCMKISSKIDNLINETANEMDVHDHTLRALITIFSGFPIAGLYHFADKLEPEEKYLHLFFFLSGCLLFIFNFGITIYHSFMCILFTILLVRILYNFQYLGFINIVFHTAYLVVGIYYTETNEYDLKWTTPHAVLVLKSVALVYDIYDGHQSRLKNNVNSTALKRIPTCLETFGYMYFPGSFLIGPYYSFSRYKSFVQRKFYKNPGRIRAAIKRTGTGIILLLLRTVGITLWPDEYFTTMEFHDQSCFKKVILIVLWGRITIYKYSSSWILVEGVLTFFGVTYQIDVDENGDYSSNWKGCENIKLSLVENPSKMGDYIRGYNVLTNNWISNYIYKRLRFLNNKMLSYVFALAYIALWHGFHSGYYMCFFNEFLAIKCERFYEREYSNLVNVHNQIFQTQLFHLVIYILLRIYVFFCVGYFFAPLPLRSFENWMPFYSSLYFIPHLVVITLHILSYLSTHNADRGRIM